MSTEAGARPRYSWNRLVAIVLLAALAVALFQFTGLDASQFTPTNIKEFILSFGALAPIIFVALYAARGVILVIPVGAMSLAGGLAFGEWWGTLLNVLGATLGSCLSFLTARYFGRGFIESLGWLHKGRIKRFDEKAAESGFKLILFVRLVPLFQYDAVNFGGGLSKIRLRDFALASFIGMVPGGFITARLGASLENIYSLEFLAALGAFILLALVPLIYRRIKKSRGPQGEDLVS
jgi:uncharacterized membrane protein YdjX (TVP38/TMEM64 family)